jgi:ABC-type glutathione transport system ATPase component
VNLLKVEDLTIEYFVQGAWVRTLDKVSFCIGRGDSAGVFGGSGCGKTTLLLGILGLLHSSGRIVSGSINFLGIELIGLSERAFREIRGERIALIPQEPSLALNPVICCGEQIVDVLRAHRVWSRKECRAEAKTVLRQVGLNDVEHFYAAYPHQLSGGQRQRVAIAQSIACEPDLLLADEPTTSLDTSTQAEILALLRRLQQERNMAMIFVSHDPFVLSEVASRILAMHNGRIATEKPTNNHSSEIALGLPELLTPASFHD